VLLKNHEDKKLMAILPAAHKINLSALNDNLPDSFALMTEEEVYQIFSECNQGAVPPATKAYNLSMICERESYQVD
jgi:Ala-tRNA(Pro) deacylase